MKYYFYCCFIISVLFKPAFATTNELKVAVFIEPPYVDLVANQLVGENIDIIKLLAHSIGLKPVLMRCPFVRCLAMIKNGKADMILGLGKSSAREKDLIFLSTPHSVQQEPLRFFTLKEKNITIKNLSSLESLLVGTLRGAVYFPLFDENKNINKIELTSREQMVNMLLRGRIDTFLEREETVLPLLSTAEYQKKVMIADFTYNKTINSYVALSKHSKAKQYAEALSKVLAKAVSDGTIEKISIANKK